MTKSELIEVLAAAGITASPRRTKAELVKLLEQHARPVTSSRPDKPAKPRHLLHVNERRRGDRACPCRADQGRAVQHRRGEVAVDDDTAEILIDDESQDVGELVVGDLELLD